LPGAAFTGSISVTVLSEGFVTQSDPPPTAMPSGDFVVEIDLTRWPEDGSMALTVLASGSVTHRSP
jgi:hypothetical protein